MFRNKWFILLLLHPSYFIIVIHLCIQKLPSSWGQNTYFLFHSTTTVPLYLFISTCWMNGFSIHLNSMHFGNSIKLYTPLFVFVSHFRWNSRSWVSMKVVSSVEAKQTFTIVILILQFEVKMTSQSQFLVFPQSKCIVLILLLTRFGFYKNQISQMAEWSILEMSVPGKIGSLKKQNILLESLECT